MTPSQVASKYIGQTEIPGNLGFNDAVFGAKMIEVGFEKSHAWCCYFTELVFKEAFPEKAADLDKLFSASTIQTFSNFKKAFYPIQYLPKLNTLVIWQRMRNGVAQSTGHAGVVTEVKNTWEFKSIEGNSNSEGGREGFEVAENPNRRVKIDVTNGLKVLGFITI